MMKKNKTLVSAITAVIVLTIAFMLGVQQGLAQIHDVEITNVTKSKNIIGQGLSMQINVTTTNIGGFPETYNVTVNGTRQVVETATLHLYARPHKAGASLRPR